MPPRRVPRWSVETARGSTLLPLGFSGLSTRSGHCPMGKPLRRDPGASPEAGRAMATMTRSPTWPAVQNNLFLARPPRRPAFARKKGGPQGFADVDRDRSSSSFDTNAGGPHPPDRSCRVPKPGFQSEGVLLYEPHPAGPDEVEASIARARVQAAVGWGGSVRPVPEVSIADRITCPGRSHSGTFNAVETEATRRTHFGAVTRQRPFTVAGSGRGRRGLVSRLRVSHSFLPSR